MANSRRIMLYAGALLAAVVATSSMAQTQRAPADVQRSYDQFIASFRAALKANDPAAVAALTAFPFFWNDPREESTFQKTVYPKLFTRKVKDCIARGRGVYERYDTGKDAFTIFCGDQLFVFTATPNGFRFTDVGVND